jgi:hypothetical protein
LTIFGLYLLLAVDGLYRITELSDSFPDAFASLSTARLKADLSLTRFHLALFFAHLSLRLIDFEFSHHFFSFLRSLQVLFISEYKDRD